MDRMLGRTEREDLEHLLRRVELARADVRAAMAVGAAGLTERDAVKLDRHLAWIHAQRSQGWDLSPLVLQLRKALGRVGVAAAGALVGAAAAWAGIANPQVFTGIVRKIPPMVAEVVGGAPPAAVAPAPTITLRVTESSPPEPAALERVSAMSGRAPAERSPAQVPDAPATAAPAPPAPAPAPAEPGPSPSTPPMSRAATTPAPPPSAPSAPSSSVPAGDAEDPAETEPGSKGDPDRKPKEAGGQDPAAPPDSTAPDSAAPPVTTLPTTPFSADAAASPSMN